MSLRGKATDQLDPGVLAASEADFDRLRRRLPPADLQAFAQEVVLRLAEKRQSRSWGRGHATPEEIEALASALMSESPTAAVDYITRLVSDGASIEAIYLDYLAGAARYLGDGWMQDEVGLTSVTVGVGRIYTIMRRIFGSRSGQVVATERTAFFCTLPGETHRLGAQMAADLSRLEGWDIRLRTDRTHEELVDDLERRPAPVVAISATRPESLGALTRLVAAIRLAAPATRVLVAGPLVSKEPEAMRWIGPDAVATELDEAMSLMEWLFDDPASRGTAPSDGAAD
ncbi:cobalamin B12-binding domain-containing protein [Histidinibacterium aquaticum]|nr:cobalamin B12-binding domain-containing protein [Histidinibacterium aquaticum]